MVLRIPQSPSITGTSPSDCLVSYPGHSLVSVLPLCRGAVGVFYSPSRLGNSILSLFDLPNAFKQFLYSNLFTIYIYIYMIRIGGKVDKYKNYNGLSYNISFFIQRISSSDSFWRYPFLNQERNITTKPIVSVWFIHFSIYFYHLVRFAKIYHYSEHSHTHTHIYTCVSFWLNFTLH